jgi:hypothetical protein
LIVAAAGTRLYGHFRLLGGYVCCQHPLLLLLLLPPPLLLC